jgi:ubiquinone/menaquinone biosynthesis C-methylase UbiE
MYNTLHHVNDKNKALGECLRVATAKGVVCIIEMNQAGKEYMRKSSGFGHDIVDPRDFLKVDSYSIDHRKGRYADSFILKKTL